MSSKYIWNVLCNEPVTNNSELLDKICANRSFIALEKNGDDIQTPTPQEYIKTHEPFKTLVEEKVKPASEEIYKAVKGGLPIIVHGDYDVDGQTATSILWRTIYNDIGYKNVFPYIPNRFDEGYGLSSESLTGMQKLLESKGFSNIDALLITVDCGIVSNKEVEDAKELGFRVIISDHHHAGEKLPESHILVWTEKATGAGIAWLISNDLLNAMGKDGDKYLDLAALGTICDLQQLTEFNRSIAKFGLAKMNTNPNIGIKALKESAAIKDFIESYHLGWVIGPRLNASGRLESAMDSVRLLSTDSYDQARTISKALDEINKQRQDKTQIDLEYAMRQTRAKHNKTEGEQIPKFIISHSSDYHEGVLGLVAGKLVQAYYRPAIAIAVNAENTMAKGSARSIEGISIIDSLRKFAPLFEKVGGHEMAAGFSIKPENIIKLQESLNSLNEWSEEVFLPKLKIDLEMAANMINLKTYALISKLKPFGAGNSEPLFVTKGLKVTSFFTFGKENQHTKLQMTDEEGNKIIGLIFNQQPSDKSEGLQFSRNLGKKDASMPAAESGSKIDVVHSLSLNEWNGNQTVEIKIKDIKLSS